MDFIMVFIGIIAIAIGLFLLYRTKGVEEDELIEKSPGAHYEPWNIALKAMIALILGFFILLAGLLS